jgi:hypothetical protein
MRPGLIPGVNLHRVDVDAGLRLADSIGYGGPMAQMVTEHALMQHRRGEEDGAERTWLTHFPGDLTSWKMILARAVVAADGSASAAEP